MAIVKFDRGLFRNGNTAKGYNYGQIEPNQIWFDRAGMVEAQCRLDADVFETEKVNPLTKYVAAVAAVGNTPATPATKINAQQGAFLMVDKANATVTVPTKAGCDAGKPIGLIYTTEMLTDERERSRRKFCGLVGEYLPRIGYVQPGMRFTTNTVQWKSDGTLSGLTTYTTSDKSLEVFNAVRTALATHPTTPIYACVVDGSDGELVIGADPDDAIGNVYCQVVAAYDNADRTCSFMFEVINKPA